MPYGWGIVILEVTTPIKIEMFHCRIKTITQNNFVWICSDSILSTTSTPSHLPYGSYCVLWCVVPTTTVCNHGHFAGAHCSLSRVKQLSNSGGRHLREPEHSQKEVEGGGENGCPHWAPGPHQEHHEDERVQSGFISQLQHIVLSCLCVLESVTEEEEDTS